MKHITSTALAAGAQENCAVSEGLSLPGMGSVTRQPPFRPVSRRDIMAAVNTCGRDLGLRQGAVVVLDALLSCLPCQDTDGRDTQVTPATLLTVYASNETLCFRAKGLTDRQLRRHLETLENAGLLQRRDSANGKRFPVMKAGKVIGAFGLDLSPLFARADELCALALKRREETEELRGLRAQILRLRATCLAFDLDEGLAAFLDGVRNLMRRASLTLVEARATLSRLTAVVTGHAAANAAAPVSEATADINPQDACTDIPPEHTQTTSAPPCSMTQSATAGFDTNSDEHPPQQHAETDETPASDGRNVRHIEPESDTKKRRLPSISAPKWAQLTEVSAFYDEPRSAQDTAAIAFEFGKMLRISQDLLATAVTKLGLWELLMLEDRIARQVDRIHCPDAYLRRILLT